MEPISTWDEYFMSMVFFISNKSKDASTKIGAVIVDPKSHAIISTGYNDLPRGCDHAPEDRHERPEKYKWYEHAERNSIYNAARIGAKTEGCIMYTNGIPCADCARGVIQAGITEVVVSKNWGEVQASAQSLEWDYIRDLIPVMLKEAGVALREYDGPITHTSKIWKRGQDISE